MKKTLLALSVLALSCSGAKVAPGGGSPLQPDMGPGTAYPCDYVSDGTRVNGHSCGGGACCTDGYDCGGSLPSCPRDTCCSSIGGGGLFEKKASTPQYREGGKPAKASPAAR